MMLIMPDNGSPEGLQLPKDTPKIRNRLLFMKDSGFIVKNLTRETQMDSMVNSETFQEGILLIPEKAFQKIGEFICPNSFNGAGITLIPKPDKGVLRKASGL